MYRPWWLPERRNLLTVNSILRLKGTECFLLISSVHDCACGTWCMICMRVILTTQGRGSSSECTPEAVAALILCTGNDGHRPPACSIHQSVTRMTRPLRASEIPAPSLWVNAEAYRNTDAGFYLCSRAGSNKVSYTRANEDNLTSFSCESSAQSLQVDTATILIDDGCHWWHMPVICCQY